MIYLAGGPWHQGWASSGRTKDLDLVLEPFCLDRTKVTARAYETCVGEHRCSPAARESNGECNAGVAERREHPINCVSWTQAATYCAAQGKRLPDDPEWIYAARGPDRTRTYPWGEHEPVSQLCWSGIARRTTTCPAAGFPEGATREGVADLVGNLEEFTASATEEFPPQRLVRGGAYYDTNPRAVAEPDTRSAAVPADYVDAFTGFRCARRAGRTR
jgi:formylglycine-generating enzyme required for sulfatase activity